MSTSPVPSITDEQIAEIERFIGFGGQFIKVKSSALTDLIARLRAAEKDAARYRWLCASAWYVGPEPRGDIEAVSWHDHNDTRDGVTYAIGAAMTEAKP